MKLRINPSIAKGVIKAPPSKSYAHRLLICAALAGESTVQGIDFSNDIKATLDCLYKAGFEIFTKDNNVYFAGFDGSHSSTNFEVNESGSTLRFLIPLMSSIFGGCAFYGSERLFKRGLSVYEDIFRSQGIKYEIAEDVIYIDGWLRNGTFDIPGNVSSQYISGLLMTLPLLSGDSVIRIDGKIESEPYVNITLDVLKMFGIVITKIGHSFFVKGNQKYQSQTVEVEGDYSNAAFLDAFNYLDGDVKVVGLKEDSYQGDKVYKKYFDELQIGHPTLDISNCIDLGPILFTMASIFNGAIFKGTHRLRIKESDRVMDLLEILEKFGVSYRVEENEVEIYKSELRPINECIELPNDHRIVMSIAVLLSLLGGEISGVEAVSKSFPRFFEVIKELGIEVIYEDQ